MACFTRKQPCLGSIWFQLTKSLADFYRSFNSYWVWRKKKSPLHHSVCLVQFVVVVVVVVFNLNYLFILLYNIVLVLPHIDLNPPWVNLCSPSWTLLPVPSPSHSSGPSQCTSPKHPVSCNGLRLAIHFTYDNLRFSDTLPYHPTLALSHRVWSPKRLFNTSVCLLLSQIHLSEFHIYVLVYYIGVSLSVLLHSVYIIGTSFIHLIRTDSNMFFLMAE